MRWKKGPTGVSGNLMQPLRLLAFIFALPAPARHPRLALLIPYFPVAPLRLDTLCARELFPFGRQLGLRKRLGARELGRWCWELRERAFWRREGREGEKRGEEELDAVPRVRLEIRFELVTRMWSSHEMRENRKGREGERTRSSLCRLRLGRSLSKNLRRHPQAGLSRQEWTCCHMRI